MPIIAMVSPLVALALCAPPSHPLIAEVFYDAIGDDTGWEFVEIFNPMPTPFVLAGARLEAGDGAGPDRWTLRWVGTPGDTVAGDGRFVIGGASVTPAPGAVVQLDLQNGPDAVRLVWPDGAVEVVGYGPHALAEYFCGAPAADAPSGQSLARMPDHSDRGSNAQDFVSAAPSPGAANLPLRDAAMVAGRLGLEPEQPAPGSAALLSGAVANRGAEPLAERELWLEASEAGSAGDRTLASMPLEARLAPGDTARFAIPLPGLTPGKRVLRVRMHLAGDQAVANDGDSIQIRVGPGALEVTEIQFHPAAGEGEWVEVRNRSDAPLSVASFSLADRRGAPGLPAAGSDPLAPDSLAILVQDRVALLARFPSLDATRVWQVTPWASLNNNDDSTRVADIVTLREVDGTPCERVPYSASGVPSGVPLERRADGSWAPASDPLGSPLEPPRSLPALAGRFEVSPRRVGAPRSMIASVGWDLPWPRGRITVDLYDLAGRRVRQVMAETSVAARGERPWQATGLPPGLYVMALLAHPEVGSGTFTASQPLRIDGSAP